MSHKLSSRIVLTAISVALIFGVAACSKTSAQDNGAQGQSAQTDQSQDPASTGNLAPTDGTQATDTSYQQQPAPAQQASPAPPVQQSAQDQSYPNGESDADYQQANYGQPVLQAQQPPPPLPQYSQPPIPGDGYIWTPGYWSYAPQATSGCRVPGRGHLRSASSGRQDIGDSLAGCMATITGFGGSMSATTAALTMASAMAASAIWVDTGPEIVSAITVRSII